MPRHKRLAELALLTVSVIVSLLLLEIGLRLFTVFPVTFSSNRAPDPRLGYVLSPALDDVDQLGFRNTSCTPDTADLLVLGDSHTYGNNVVVDENFPSVLGSLLDRCVYNFGVGSYGIFQYKTLLDDAAALPADNVVLAFYPTNDLDTSLSACGLVESKAWLDYAEQHNLELPVCSAADRAQLRVGPFFERTATVQAIEHLGDSLFPDGDDDAAIDEKTHYLFGDGQAVRKGRVRRHSETTSLDVDNIRINFDLSKAVLSEAADRLAAASIGFTIVLIPSKERVLYEWAGLTGRDRDPTFADQVGSELHLIDLYRDFFEANAIPYVDATPWVVEALAAAVKRGEPFYKVDDGHPFAAGYAAYAEAAASALEQIEQNGGQ